VNLWTPEEWEARLKTAPPGTREAINEAYDAFIESHGTFARLQNRVYFFACTAEKKTYEDAAFDAYRAEDAAFKRYCNLCEELKKEV
jgi:hypothetical protein